MNKYTELKDKHSKMVNKFPMGFAFTTKQFKEAKEKLGVTSNDELLSIPGGGFIRKTDKTAYAAMLLLMESDDKEAMKDDKYLYQGFLYELANHEYCFTYEAGDTLDCFGLTIDEIRDDKRLRAIWLKARDKYLSTCNY